MTGSGDVPVAGGGTAGLSAAPVPGRARRRTPVVDTGEPRNAPSAQLQGRPARDGTAPAEFPAVGREEIARYGAEPVRNRAVDAVRDGRGFTVEPASGRTVRARRLVIATGLRGELPPVRGTGRAVRPGCGPPPLLPRPGGARPAGRETSARPCGV